MSKKDQAHECCGQCQNETEVVEECACAMREEELEKQVLELKDHLLRSNAELINYRRRKEEEVSKLLKYQGEDFIKSILPVIDDFERAINMDDTNLDDELSKFLQGFKMMYANLELILINNEVKAMDCLHQPFDPHFHQAVLTDKNEAYASGIITDVLAKGYTYKDRVIRPAMVKVNE